jgi:hypothetical protein
MHIWYYYSTNFLMRRHVYVFDVVLQQESVTTDKTSFMYNTFQLREIQYSIVFKKSLFSIKKNQCFNKLYVHTDC